VEFVLKGMVQLVRSYSPAPCPANATVHQYSDVLLTYLAGTSLDGLEHAPHFVRLRCAWTQSSTGGILETYAAVPKASRRENVQYHSGHSLVRVPGVSGVYRVQIYQHNGPVQWAPRPDLNILSYFGVLLEEAG
jgi:hypothetical protein